MSTADGTHGVQVFATFPSWAPLVVPAAGRSILGRKCKRFKLSVTAHSSHVTFCKMRDEPIRSIGGPSLMGQGIEAGFLAPVSRQLGGLCHIWVRGKIFKQNACDLKPQTAVSHSTPCQSSTLSWFICFGFEVAIKTRKPPDLGHC